MRSAIRLSGSSEASIRLLPHDKSHKLQFWSLRALNLSERYVNTLRFTTKLL